MVWTINLQEFRGGSKVARYNPGHPTELEFQIDKEYIFSKSIFQILHGIELYFKISHVDCYSNLTGNPVFFINLSLGGRESWWGKGSGSVKN